MKEALLVRSINVPPKGGPEWNRQFLGVSVEEEGARVPEGWTQTIENDQVTPLGTSPQEARQTPS